MGKWQTYLNINTIGEHFAHFVEKLAYKYTKDKKKPKEHPRFDSDKICLWCANYEDGRCLCWSDSESDFCPNPVLSCKLFIEKYQ
jgi:hypothetical protein